MTDQFYFEPLESELGQASDLFASRGQSSSTLNVIERSGELAFEFEPSNNRDRYAVVKQERGGATILGQDFEIYARFEYASSNFGNNGLCGQSFTDEPTDVNPTALQGNFRGQNDELRLQEVVSGTTTTLAASSNLPGNGALVDTWLTLEGDQLTFYWELVSDPSVNEELTTTTDPATEAGEIGFFNFRATAAWIYRIGIGTNGAEAPIEPLDDGADTLTIDQVRHGHTVEQLSLTQAVTLAVADTFQAHRAEHPELLQAATLSVDGVSHLHTAEQAVLAQAHALAVANALHGHAAAAVALTQANTVSAHAVRHPHRTQTLELGVGDTVTVRDVLHAQTAHAVEITQAGIIAVQTVRQQHRADPVVLSESITLSPQSAVHGHTTEALALTQEHILAVRSLVHGQTAEQIQLLADATLVVSDVLHAHLVDRVIFDGTVFRAGRLIVVQGHERLIVVAPTQPFIRVRH